MKTEIFKNKQEFNARADKKVNGVTQEFANNNPTFSSMNESNKGCWNCWNCRYCSDCSDCSYCYSCYSCSYCYSCYSCSDCYSCYSCSDCSDCSDCYLSKRVAGTKGDKTVFAIPVVENIHQKVFEAISTKPEAFDMGSWHNKEASCGTTHCRAGWVVELGGEAGYALEKQTSSVFAALQIYKASCPELPVSPYRFYESNDLAMENIKEYAEKEAELKAK